MTPATHETCLITLPDGVQVVSPHGPNLLDPLKPFGDIDALRQRIVKALSDVGLPLTAMETLTVPYTKGSLEPTVRLT